MTHLMAVAGTAEFSFDQLDDEGAPLYRYRLTREWDADLAKVVNFIGLNPSTADAMHDDPTIRRCIGFAKSWGCGRLVMTNLYAWRSTTPLIRFPEDLGKVNARAMERAISESNLVVAAWGIHANPGWALNCWKVLTERYPTKTFRCLGKTKDGAPRHPLYLPRGTELEIWP